MARFLFTASNTCEYYTDGKEFDTYHRFTDKEVRDIWNLRVGATPHVTDEYFKADRIKIKRTE